MEKYYHTLICSVPRLASIKLTQNVYWHSFTTSSLVKRTMPHSALDLVADTYGKQLCTLSFLIHVDGGAVVFFVCYIFV